MTIGFGEESLGQIDHLVLDTSQFDDLTLIEPMDWFQAWMVSEELGTKTIEHNILGLEIVMVDEYPDYRPRIDLTDPAGLTIVTNSCHGTAAHMANPPEHHDDKRPGTWARSKVGVPLPRAGAEGAFRDQAMSNRSAFITLTQAATKSVTNLPALSFWA